MNMKFDDFVEKYRTLTGLEIKGPLTEHQFLGGNSFAYALDRIIGLILCEEMEKRK